MTTGRTDPFPWRFAVTLVFAGFALYLLRDILLPFFVAFGLAYVLSPVVEAGTRRLRLPRPLTVIILYLVVLGPLGLLIAYFGPLLAQHTGAVLGDLEGSVDRFTTNLFAGKEFNVLGQTLNATVVARLLTEKLHTLAATPLDMVPLATFAVKALLAGVLTLVVLFYFLVDGEGLFRGILWLTPTEYQDWIRHLAGKLYDVIGRFLRGLLVIVFFTAVVTWGAFSFVFHLPHAVPIAIAVGVLELIPVLGPTTSGVITSMAAYGHGGILFMLQVILFYILLRLTIDQVVGPIVLGRAVSLPPVAVIFAFLAASTLWGFLGLLLAIPLAAMLKVVCEERNAWRLAASESGLKKEGRDSASPVS